MSCNTDIRTRALRGINRGRQRVADFGLRRYAVTLIRRTWSGQYIGQGDSSSTTITITPTPKVVDAFSGMAGNWKMLEYIQTHGQQITDRYWEISRITPAFVDQCSSVTGGYTPVQIKMEPPSDTKNVEPVVALIGDDGLLRECVQVQVDIDKPFEYRMLVKETDRPLQGPRSIVVTKNGTASFTATATYQDGITSVVSSLVTWRSDNPAFQIDTSGGILTPLGTGNVFASLGGITSLAVAYP